MKGNTPPVAPGRLPSLAHSWALARDPLGYLASLRSFGEVVRITPARREIYVVNSLKLVRALLVDNQMQCERGTIFERARPVFGNGLILSEKETHRHQRRVLQPAFCDRRIERYATVMSRIAEHRIRGWQAGQTLAVNREFHNLGVAMLTGALFGVRLDASTARRMESALSEIVRGLVWQALYPAPWMVKLPLPVNRRYLRAATDLRRIADAILHEYRSSWSEPDDVLALLSADLHTDAADRPVSGEGLDDARIDAVVTLLVTGAETASTTLAWLCYELDRHPGIDRTVVAELADSIGDGPVTVEAIQELPYLNRVVAETLRLHTPNWILMRRSLEQPLTLGGWNVPAHSEILFSLTALHRDPRVYADPLRFDPDRPELSNARSSRTDFMPFGIGKHKCIGDGFAWTELMIAAAVILREWRLVCEPGQLVEEALWTTVQPRRLTMRLVAR